MSETITSTEAELPLFQIKCRFTGAVRFEGRFGSLRLCVEAAVKAGANLADAYLADANLAGANLADANLARANLADANLARANLARANLAGAYLAGAYLARTYLADANLARANLAGAKIGIKAGGDAFLAGSLPVLHIGPIGSRAAMLTACATDKGVMAQTGCFGPAPLVEFAAAVQAEHADNEHGRAYRAAIALIEAIFPAPASQQETA